MSDEQHATDTPAGHDNNEEEREEEGGHNTEGGGPDNNQDQGNEDHQHDGGGRVGAITPRTQPDYLVVARTNSREDKKAKTNLEVEFFCVSDTDVLVTSVNRVSGDYTMYSAVRASTRSQSGNYLISEIFIVVGEPLQLSAATPVTVRGVLLENVSAGKKEPLLKLAFLDEKGKVGTKTLSGAQFACKSGAGQQVIVSSSNLVAQTSGDVQAILMETRTNLSAIPEVPPSRNQTGSDLRPIQTTLDTLDTKVEKLCQQVGTLSPTEFTKLLKNKRVAGAIRDAVCDAVRDAVQKVVATALGKMEKRLESLEESIKSSSTEKEGGMDVAGKRKRYDEEDRTPRRDRSGDSATFGDFEQPSSSHMQRFQAPPSPQVYGQPLQYVSPPPRPPMPPAPMPPAQRYGGPYNSYESQQKMPRMMQVCQHCQFPQWQCQCYM